MFDEIGYDPTVKMERSISFEDSDNRDTPKVSFAPLPAPNEHRRETLEDTSASLSLTKDNVEVKAEEESASSKESGEDLANGHASSSDDYSMNPADYRLEEPIGYGSSAVVYMALYVPTQVRVAIKVIELDKYEKIQIESLRREIQVMRLCRHPNLLGVLASFVHESQIWIVTPFVGAGSCLDLLRVPEFRTGILNEAAIATILYQALQGLAYLHEHGHIHRDVKAGNLLIDLDGQVQLADFGVSASLTDYADGRAAGGSSGEGEHKAGPRVRKTFVGTPCWMAPEVMEMTKGYDAKADIWSFGITAYELANGHAPYSKLPAMKVIFVTLSNDPPKFNRHRSKVTFSRAFKEIIQLCLQKDPEKRPTAESLLKHPFFKQAKRKDYLVAEVLAEMPPIQQRARAHVAKVNDRRRASAADTTVTQPEELSWDFSSSASGESEDEELAGLEVWANNATMDKRGRFLVEPNAGTLTSPISSPTTSDEQQVQASVQSGCNQDEQCWSEIKKGRFSVNPSAATAGETANPPATATTVHSPNSPTSSACPATIDEEEGRKSRFEVVLPAPQDPRPRLVSQPTEMQSSAAALGLASDEPISPGSTTANIHRPNPQNVRTSSLNTERHLSNAESYVPSPYSSWNHQPTVMIDHLLHQVEMMRHHLLELRARWPVNPSYPNPAYPTPGYTLPHGLPAEYFMQAHYSGSPPHSAHPNLADLATYQPHVVERFVRSPPDQQSLDPIERQMAQLRLENEQLKRRLL